MYRIRITISSPGLSLALGVVLSSCPIMGADVLGDGDVLASFLISDCGVSSSGEIEIKSLALSRLFIIGVFFGLLIMKNRSCPFLFINTYSFEPVLLRNYHMRVN